MTMRIRTPIFAIALALLLLGFDAARANPRIGDVAPAIEVTSLDGRALKLGPRPGRVLIVDFFATWCGPCKDAMRDLHALTESLPNRTTLVVIDVGESPSQVRAYFAEHPLPPGAELGLDRLGQLARSFGHDRFPTTFLISDSGIIKHINRGYGPGYPARMASWLQQMLQEMSNNSPANAR